MILDGHPNIRRARDEDLRLGLRSFPVGEYLILYRMQDDDAIILRVVRAAGISSHYSGIEDVCDDLFYLRTAAAESFGTA